MKRRTMTILFISGFLSAAYIAMPSFVSSQAPPGPLPPAKPVPPTQGATQSNESRHQRQKPTLAGSWKLNRDESDDPRKKMQEARGSNGGNNGGGPSGGGRRMGGGFPGVRGRGPYGRRGGGNGSGQSDNDRKRMQELFRPADSLTIVQKDAEVDLTDDQNRKRIFYADGRQLQKSKDDDYQEIAARWEDGRLVSEEKGARGGKLIRPSHSSIPDKQKNNA